MKLRLLITEACNRNCPLCVNKQYNLAKLRVERNFHKYSEIILTGGEPMLDPNYLIEVINHLKLRINEDCKIWLHTAKVDDLYGVLCVLDLIDGITITLHNKADIPDLITLDDQLFAGRPRWKRKSFKLCVFDNVYFTRSDLHMNWTIHNIKWLTDCPLPEGEVFKRFAFLG